MSGEQVVPARMVAMYGGCGSKVHHLFDLSICCVLGGDRGVRSLCSAIDVTMALPITTESKPTRLCLRCAAELPKRTIEDDSARWARLRGDEVFLLAPPPPRGVWAFHVQCDWKAEQRAEVVRQAGDASDGTSSIDDLQARLDTITMKIREMSDVAEHVRERLQRIRDTGDES